MRFSQGFLGCADSGKDSSKRIYLFTNDDDPLNGDKSEEDPVVQSARDALDMGAELQLFQMKHGEAGFEVDKFYKR